MCVLGVVLNHSEPELQEFGGHLPSLSYGCWDPNYYLIDPQNFTFKKGYQSCWTMTHPSDLMLAPP